eukprot:1284929-Rhodomonas_salina.1
MGGSEKISSVVFSVVAAVSAVLDGTIEHSIQTSVSVSSRFSSAPKWIRYLSAVVMVSSIVPVGDAVA